MMTEGAKSNSTPEPVSEWIVRLAIRMTIGTGFLTLVCETCVLLTAYSAMYRLVELVFVISILIILGFKFNAFTRAYFNENKRRPSVFPCMDLALLCPFTLLQIMAQLVYIPHEDEKLAYFISYALLLLSFGEMFSQTILLAYIFHLVKRQRHSLVGQEEEEEEERDSLIPTHGKRTMLIGVSRASEKPSELGLPIYSDKK
jgi:hypothetical protein